MSESLSNRAFEPDTKPVKVENAPKPHLKAVTSTKAKTDAENLESFTPLPEHEHALSEFAAEAEAEKSWKTLPRMTAMHAIIAVLSLVAVVEFGALVWQSNAQPPAVDVPPTGSVAIESSPAGATIAINGQNQSVTPATMALNPGEYVLSVTLGDVTQHIPLVVRRGATSTERIYFPEAAPVAAARTTAAAKPADPAPAPPAPAAPAGAVGGWLSVSSPIDLQLYENGTLIGTSSTQRIMLPVGRHNIEAVNTLVGYKQSSTVQVSAGSVARLAPQIPNATLNINAIPWADVSVDGKRLGPTPLGNVSLPIGSHDVVFTHPQLGERRQAVLVTLNGQNRVSVNLNQR
jgi:PEGA domain-containing protein